MGEDKAQHSAKRGASWRRLAWWRRRAQTDAGEHYASAPPPDQPLSVWAALESVPGLLDGARLPNGVVELVIHDHGSSKRHLFDIHDGRLTYVEPGSTVPWVSIAGSPRAWSMALGPMGEVRELRITGERHLARSVLAALPKWATNPRIGERRAPA